MNPFIYLYNYDLTHITTDLEINEIVLNNNIHHIAKSRKWKNDIYKYIYEKYKGNWRCETWIRGDECKNDKNISDIKIIEWDENYKYKSSQDHSKYACNKNGYTFIGDINRMTSQFHRGGGGIVLHDDIICNLFNIIMQ